jgi:hypothetical protein
MRSTVLDGKVTCSSIHAPSAGSRRRANSTTAVRARCRRTGGGTGPRRRTRRGWRAAPRGEVADDVRRLDVERAGRGVDVIAAAGHGERDEPDALVARRVEHRLGMGGGVEEAVEHADDARAVTRGPALDDRVEEILGLELVADVRMQPAIPAPSPSCRGRTCSPSTRPSGR